MNPIDSIRKYVRAANFLTAAQLYLQDNFLLERALTFDDIKPRLLGHWGTCPGINFVYANLNYIIKKYEQEMLFVLGPGHGFPALQANLFIEGTLGKYYPHATPTKSGIAYIIKNFSWPYGFPSHSNPGTPGVIVEGGELGYALSTSFGAILDNPPLIVACLIGDGEAETGPTATAWHINKFIDPASNGAVLPILHVNGYKISGPTIFGRMSNKELLSLFWGYGYQPLIVEGYDPYGMMIKVLEQSIRVIKKIQFTAQRSRSVVSPRWPMIILKTPKGWTGIKTLHGEKIEDNHLSHQVVAMKAKSDQEELTVLEQWLQSYKFHELFHRKAGFHGDIKQLIPGQKLRMGDNPRVRGKAFKPLILPDPKQFAEDATIPGTIGSSSMRRAGLYLNEVFKLNKKSANVRMMSPDETYSNKLDAVFEATTRAFVWPTKPWDKDISSTGRVMEMLSEHTLQGMAQGYILSGRHAVFASYESFIQIVSSMADQYAKFLKIANEVPWRGQIASLNYILTSSGWRQEHNGFSHQNPGFIGNMLEKHGCFIKVYFPPDGNSTLAVMQSCLESRNGINIIVAGKTLEPRWLTVEQAEQALVEGIATWEFASDSDPHIVVAAIGDYLTKEALAAIDIVKSISEKIRLRFVNVIELSSLGIGNPECRVAVDFEKYFTATKPVIINFHGYPEAIKAMLIDQKNPERFSVHGYIENGSTTTPFDMHVRNQTSRYHLAVEIIKQAKYHQIIQNAKAEEQIKSLTRKISNHTSYIKRFGVDPPEIENWQWTRNT